MNTKKIIKILLLFVLFNSILFSLLFYLNYVMRNKEYEGAQDLFAKWRPQNADIVFIGNSHQFCSIDPDLLYEEYGIESYMLATSAQTVPMSYYAALEAIELNKPDKIVFEVSYVANDFRTLAGMDHCFFDGFPNCKARKLALEDLIPKNEQIYYLFPLGMFHSRWKEVTKTDFEGFPLSNRGGVHFEEVTNNWDIYVVDENDKEKMPREMEKYFRKLIELCKENDVELILYTAPFNGLYFDEGSLDDLKGRQRVFNYVADIAKEYGLEYHNLFHEIDKLGLDNATDWLDTQHVNYLGQEKITRYMMESGYLGY